MLLSPSPIDALFTFHGCKYFFQQIFQNEFSILSPIHTITLYSTTHLGSFFFTQPPPPVPRSFKIGQGGNLENIQPDISTGKRNGKGLIALVLPFQNLMNCCWSEDDTFGTRRRGSPLNLLFLKLWIRWLNFSIRNWVGKKCKILLFFLQEFGDHIFWKQLLLTWSSAERFRFSFIRNRIFSTWVVDNF